MEDAAGRNCTVATAADGASFVDVALTEFAGSLRCRLNPIQIAATATMMTTTRTAVRFEIYMEDVPAYARGIAVNSSKSCCHAATQAQKCEKIGRAHV